MMWQTKWRAAATGGGATVTVSSNAYWPLRTVTGWDCPDCPDLELSNRPVRIRMPGGMVGVPLGMDVPFADLARLSVRDSRAVAF
jgi:hypothetical protein